jgi:hypothetical protein
MFVRITAITGTAHGLLDLAVALWLSNEDIVFIITLHPPFDYFFCLFCSTLGLELCTPTLGLLSGLQKFLYLLWEYWC